MPVSIVFFFFFTSMNSSNTLLISCHVKVSARSAAQNQPQHPGKRLEKCSRGDAFIDAAAQVSELTGTKS